MSNWFIAIRETVRGVRALELRTDAGKVDATFVILLLLVFALVMLLSSTLTDKIIAGVVLCLMFPASLVAIVAAEGFPSRARDD